MHIEEHREAQRMLIWKRTKLQAGRMTTDQYKLCKIHVLQQYL